MRIAVPAIAGMLACSALALAASDIPTRYSGAFPSDGERTRITGTFTGKSLTLQFVAKVAAGRDPTRSGSYACSATSPTQTRCTGTFRSGDGKYTGSQYVIVTWGAGKPTAISFGH